MSNKAKIAIAILIILAIIVAVYGVTSNMLKKDKKSNKKDEFSNIMEFMNEHHDNNIQENNTESENNIVNENITSDKNEINNEIKNNVKNDIQNSNTVIGKEEQVSNNENMQIKDKQKAIELAKEEWGISIDSYDFQVSELKSDGTYDVSVINKANRNVITIYNVNINTATVTE